MGRGDNDNTVKLTADEQRIRRLLSMALVFTNKGTPISTIDVNTTFYPDSDGETFSKRFQRDRAALASLGTVIVQTQDADGGVAWEIDKALSFPDPQNLSIRDAVAIDLACRPLMSDPTFPYPDALASALEKVDGSFDGMLPGVRLEPARPNSAFRTLRRCFEQRRFANIVYSDAAGRETERTIAIFGSFDLRNHVYLVAADVVDGTVRTHDIRLFRADRVKRASAIASSRYVVPDDFDPADYKVLPFQIGEAQAEVEFVVPESRVREVRHDTLGRGEWTKEDDGMVLRVPASNLQAAASWAIAEGIRPLAPAEVVSAWRQTLEGVLSDGEGK
jgi:predicted DNA-binding transcriptional regulator YafY